MEISIGGHWNELEALDQINYLELEAAFLALRVFLPLIKGSHVQWAWATELLGGTRSQLLTALALDILHYPLDRNMVISAIQVPGN